jgi:hypothetical protein
VPHRYRTLFKAQSGSRIHSVGQPEPLSFDYFSLELEKFRVVTAAGICCQEYTT